MKIGFDAKRAAQNRTGLGNYSRFIVSALKNYSAEDEFMLYAPDPNKSGLLDEYRQDLNITTHYPKTSFGKRFRSLWRVKGITADLKKDKVDIFHGLSNELPLNIHKAEKLKSIVTIHDLIFLRYPSYYRFFDRMIYNYKFRKACKNADRIIAVSEMTKRDIVSFYHIPAEKIDVVYQGCSKEFAKEAGEETKRQVKEKYDLPERFILYLGTIEERKNLMLLAKALLHTNTDVPVIAVGKRTAYAKNVDAFIEDNNLSDRIKLISGVPFAELPALYQMASVFVFPSRFEGFGIPIIEAMNSGVPVIAATGSCLEEAGGPDSIYIDPDDVTGLAQAIDNVLTDEALRETMVKKGKEYVLRFEDKIIARDVMDVYRKTCSED